MRARLRALRSDKRGGVMIVSAVSLVALIASTALAVDVGNVYLAKRHLQGATDAAALYAATATTNHDAAVRAALADNGLAGKTTFIVTPGSYVPNGDIAAGARFVPGATAGNSARVQVEQDVPLFFAGMLTSSNKMRIVANATAAKIDYAAFSIGSRLASVQGGLPNAILSSLAGTNLNLSVMDYNALVQTNVNLLTFTKALQSQINLQGATFGETLDTNITLPKAIAALAAASTGPGATSLSRLQASVPSTTIKLSDLIDLGPFAKTDHSDPSTAITIDAYAIVQQMLQLANGNRQVTSDLGISVPGVASTTMTLAIGQHAAHSPWLTVAKDGSVVVRTSQARLYLDSQIGGAAKLGLLSLRTPIYVELAEASAKLGSITCRSGRSQPAVSLEVLPSVGKVSVADLNMSTFANFSLPATERPAVIARLPLATVTGQSSIKFGGLVWQTVPFSAAEIAAGSSKTVSTKDVVGGVAASLIKTMDLKASLIGIGLDASVLTGTIGTALTPLAPALDQILDEVTGLLGARIGQADVRVDGVRCGKPTLVG